MAKLLLEPMAFRDNATRRRGYIFCPACFEQGQKTYPDEPRTWINYALHCLIVAGEGAWGFNQDFDAPTFTPSLLSRGEIVCHSFIMDGKMSYSGDCTHGRANQVMDLLDVQIFLDQNPDFGKAYEDGGTG